MPCLHHRGPVLGDFTHPAKGGVQNKTPTPPAPHKHTHTSPQRGTSCEVVALVDSLALAVLPESAHLLDRSEVEVDRCDLKSKSVTAILNE